MWDKKFARDFSRTRLDAAAAARPTTVPVATSAAPGRTTRGEDVAAPGAQGHADGNLSPPLRYGVAEQAVEAERGQQERERREAADEDGDEAGLGHRGRQPGVHGHHRRDRCAGARLGHRLAEERDRRERVARRIPWDRPVDRDLGLDCAGGGGLLSACRWRRRGRRCRPRWRANPGV